MAVQLTESNGGKTLEVAVSGTLSHSDYSRFVPTFERLVQQHGTIRVLFEMTDFHGWDGAALWDDIKLDLKHFADVERLAMVGDKSWEKAMSVFCRPFTTATIRYFDRAAIGNARGWLAAGAR
jgi:hypothetical protein